MALQHLPFVTGLLFVTAVMGGRDYQRYKVFVSTTNGPSCGTDASVYIVIYGDKGFTEWKELDHKHHDDFERNSDDFFVRYMLDVGTKLTLVKVQQRFDPELWCIEGIKVTYKGIRYHFSPYPGRYGDNSIRDLRYVGEEVANGSKREEACGSVLALCALLAVWLARATHMVTV